MTGSPKNTTIRINELSVPLEEGSEPLPALQKHLQKGLNLTPWDYTNLTIAQRALDARGKHPTFRFTVDLDVAVATAERLVDSHKAHRPKKIGRYTWTLPAKPQGPRPIIAGAGPAGLFAALTLAEAGWAPILIERGKQVEARAKDVSRLYSKGELQEESNVCYGEGGAGTFSDGKLYTRISDERVLRFMEALVANGANPDILINNRPHLGTDKLIALLKSLRRHLESLGTTLLYSTSVQDFVLKDERVHGVRLSSGETLDAGGVILATGHSAHDIWHRLHAHGVPMESRPFAVGFRVEHPQELINSIRYGKAHTNTPGLPAADYKLAHTEKGADGRGVYSFCMCPGGVVVATPTRAGELCINGMSHAARSGRFANSALVVTVSPEDYGSEDLFAGVAFQRSIERAAYEAGGGDFVAPAARLTDFLKGTTSQTLGSTSYRRGLTSTDLGTLYPASVTQVLRDALHPFERKMRGYLTNEATLIGVETRTASPLRVLRHPDSLEAVGAAGLYPCGEGMGYGGGIASAAVDGIRAAEALLTTLGAQKIEKK